MGHLCDGYSIRKGYEVAESPRVYEVCVPSCISVRGISVEMHANYTLGDDEAPRLQNPQEWGEYVDMHTSPTPANASAMEHFGPCWSWLGPSGSDLRIGGKFNRILGWNPPDSFIYHINV